MSLCLYIFKSLIKEKFMNPEHLEILIEYLFFVWTILLVPIGILIIAIIISLVKRKGKFNKIVVWEGVVLALVLIMGIAYTAPVAIDVSQNSIETAQYSYAYYYNQDESNNLFYRSVLVKTDDETKLYLNDVKDDFPYEIENGTIIYAKHSKIILEYTGTVINQDHF